MKVTVFGTGLMGKAAAYDLVRQPNIELVRIVGRDATQVNAVAKWLNHHKIETKVADVSNQQAAQRALLGTDLALSCLPYNWNLSLTKAAIASRTHLLDLGGNSDVVESQRSLSEEAAAAHCLIVPDCGLAPGLVSVLTKFFVESLDTVAHVRLRVGGLPQQPQPPLNYALVFSVQGLINEYIEPVTRLRAGKIELASPLSDLELLELSDPYGVMEAFNTSGGISTLPQTYKGQIGALDYKTIRYPGHCEQIKLLYELGLTSSTPLDLNGIQVSPRAVLEAVLVKVFPMNQPDVVLLKAWAEGTRDGRPRTITTECIDYFDPASGLSAMQRMTAFSATSLISLLASGKIIETGVRTLEHFVPVKEFFDELARRGIVLSHSVQ